jgi:predicted metal-binding protein
MVYREERVAMNALNAAQKERLRQAALAGGADFTAWADPAAIPVLPELQDICRQNGCGFFNTSWQGPPAIGTVFDLLPLIRTAAAALVLQTVSQLEDSFDYPGMLAAKDRHQAVVAQAAARIRPLTPDFQLVVLAAGCCHLCDPCPYPGAPCLHPEEAMPPVEGYGIHVSGLLEQCGLRYNNGRDTVSFVGLILFTSMS